MSDFPRAASNEPLLADPLLFAGDVVGSRYRVDRLLEVEDTAALFAGRDLELDRPVLVELLLAGLNSQAAITRRFANGTGAAVVSSDEAIIEVGIARQTDGGARCFVVLPARQCERAASAQDVVETTRLRSIEPLLQLARPIDALAPTAPKGMHEKSTALHVTNHVRRRPVVTGARAQPSRTRQVAGVAVTLLVVACAVAAIVAATTPPEVVRPERPLPMSSRARESVRSLVENGLAKT